ncbi:MAG: 4Fe-4S binding protein [Acidobacteria bacterium]|nr:4Fe-4S binding protein [Acidobacteriota bacterium]
MELITIDEDRCRKDGFCAWECPSAIIELPGDGWPRIKPGQEEGCMDCGHCVAVCPHDALRHERIPRAGSPALRDDLRIGEAQAAQFLRARRSIRHFAERPVEKDKILKLIETARYAPTGGNRQEVEWLVLDDGPRLREIGALTVAWLRKVVEDPRAVAAAPYLLPTIAAWDAGEDTVLRGAPALVVAMAPAEVMTGTVDVTIAQAYLDLYAPVLGLGTCWAGLLQGAMANAPETRAAVGIPEGYPHHYALMLGYPDVRFFRTPERKAPRITFA